MKTEKLVFTPEEISQIDKKLPFIVFDWAKNLIFHILNKAQNNNVEVVYMNTSKTLYGSNTETKVEYFYEKLPKQLGFKKETVKLRQKTEIFWAYHFNTTASNLLNLVKIATKTFTIEEIPQKYQGAILQIIGRKSAYTIEDIKNAYNIISQKSKPKKSVARFFYDWSKTWSGSQRFMEKISSKPDQVVIQKIPSDLQTYISQDEILVKFWNFIMKQSNHFGSDSLGFALVNKYNNKIWVINEIQTDTLNHYLYERNKQWKDKVVEKTETSWDSIKDMLEAQNRSNWIPILETNTRMKEYVMANPNTIGQLCDNSLDIEKWMKEQRENMSNIPQDVIDNLTRQIANCNFKSRIILIG